MPDFSVIIRGVSPDKFAEIFAASTRKAREAYFHRHNIKKAKASNRVKSMAGQAEVRTKQLFEVLLEKDDDELVEEVLRTWLLTKREMLAMALDHLEIKHENGLTEAEDIDERFEKLAVKDLKALIDKLGETHPKEDVGLYLRFMGAQKVDEALS
jgi:hypothetical protein